MCMGNSVKGAAARRQTTAGSASCLGGALNSATVLREAFNTFRCAGILIAALIAGATISSAADNPAGGWLAVEFPRDSPVLLVSSALGPSTPHIRGASLAMDIHASLLLRNTGAKPISGITLTVDAQGIMPSGRGSVTIPSLRLEPGDVFPVRLDLQLLRPFNAVRTEADPAMVRVSLDCALFNDFSAYGPDKLGSRRTLMVYELEARRDRRYLAALIGSGRFTQIREELNFGLQDLTPEQLGLELLHRPRTNPERERAFAVGAVSFPSAPVQPLGGNAQVFENEVRAPRVELRNTSQKPVRAIDVGWIIRDDRGRDFVAGSVPAAVELAPVQQTAHTIESGTLRFSRPTGQPMVIGGLMTFVNDVEFSDGKLWIPSRADIDKATSDPLLRRSLADSPEQQRLADIYRRKGMSGLAEELKRLD